MLKYFEKCMLLISSQPNNLQGFSAQLSGSPVTHWSELLLVYATATPAAAARVPHLPTARLCRCLCLFVFFPPLAP